MPPPTQSEHHNLLLRRMEPSDYQLLAPYLEPFQEQLGHVLFHEGQKVEHAYFVSDGVLSLVGTWPEGQRVETGVLGSEGFGPTGLALGDDQAPFEGQVQLDTDGYRVRTDAFRTAFEASATLRSILLRFVHVFSIQTASTALSNAIYPMEERLARWILMCDDRCRSGELPLTHEFMSVMLAVRRPSVTTALHVLEGHGLIHAERRLVTVRDRAALEEFVGDAYGAPERAYERLLGPLQ